MTVTAQNVVVRYPNKKPTVMRGKPEDIRAALTKKYGELRNELPLAELNEDPVVTPEPL